MTTEPDSIITIEPAPDVLGANKFRANCSACTRSFIINYPTDRNVLIVCPSCGNIKTPEWKDNVTFEEQK